MFPKLFEVGALTAHSYGALLVLAFLAAGAVSFLAARRQGIDSRHIVDMGLYIFFAGLIGTRLLQLVVELDLYWQNPRRLLDLWQVGGAFYGGLIGGGLAGFWYLRKHRLPALRVADVVAPGIALGQTIGRVGCLLGGCCWGRPTDVPWAIVFTSTYAHEHMGVPLHVPLHPTQVYEAAVTLALFGVTLSLLPRKRFDGQVLAVYVAGYALARFVMEYFRDDPRGSVLGALSTSQLISLIGLAAVIAWGILARRAAAPGRVA